ncbi:MAG: FecR domain-containing protein [Terriglobia bacterium]
MRRNDARTVVALGLVLVLAPWPGLSANLSVGKVIPRAGTSMLNGTEVKLPTTVFSGDTIVTRAESWALLLLSQDEQVHLGPSSSAALKGDRDKLVVRLDHGLTVARSGHSRAISVAARGLWLQPSGVTTYEVTVSEQAIVVSSHEGSVEVKGADRAVTVPAGRAARFETRDDRKRPKGAGVQTGLSAGAKTAIWILVATGVAAAIAVPLALDDDKKEPVVSPSTP